ncbi:MAG: hypothetical protein ABSD85_11750 [Acidimicrobiales bacterium]
MSDYLLMALPDGLVRDLLARATVERVDPGDLLVDILCSELPDAFAEAVAAVLQTKSTPESRPRGADDLDSTPLVERNLTARRLTQGVSGVSAP